MKKFKIVILSSLIIFSSCNMSDYSEDLTGGYTFGHDGEDNSFIYGKHRIYSNVIDYRFDSDYIVACQKPNRPRYLSQLASKLINDYTGYVAYNRDSLSEKFYKSRQEILADSVVYKIFKSKNVGLNNSLEDILKSEEIADSIIINNPKHKRIFAMNKVYWIIKVKENKLFGPLSKLEFDLKATELNLGKELKL